MHNIEDLLGTLRGLRARASEIDSEFADRVMSPEGKEEWNSVNAEIDQTETLVTELRSRTARLEQIAGDPSHVENERSAPQIARPGVARGSDIWDLSTVPSSYLDSSRSAHELQERSLRALETSGLTADSQSHIEGLLTSPEVSKRVMETGSQQYRSAFAKTLLGQSLTSEETRAMSVGVNASGGFAVPYTLDPTLIPTGVKNVNPLRAISRTVQITGIEWRGVTAGNIVISRDPEATEVSDDSPTIGQTVIKAQKVQGFVPYSIEVEQDWSSFLTEMGNLFAQAKDEEEAAAFSNGTGIDPQPQGVLVGANVTVPTGTIGAFAVGDLYALEGALPDRYRANASLMANRAVYSKVRQFAGSAGGENVWLSIAQTVGDNAGRISNTLLGYPAYENSLMSSAVATGNAIAILGDFSSGFVIVDRIGMSVEIVQHLVGVNHRPTGQRGLYMNYRNGSAVVSPNSFRKLVVG
ncbi:MAG: phage major capsid protein [Thermomicrobiales bacterium]